MKNHVYLKRSKQVKLPDNRILAVELRAFAQTQFAGQTAHRRVREPLNDGDFKQR